MVFFCWWGCGSFAFARSITGDRCQGHESGIAMIEKTDNPRIFIQHEHELLREIGETLYGRFWQTQMARDTGYSIRSIQRYAAGTRTPPVKLFSRLFGVARWRQNAIASTLVDLIGYRRLDNIQSGRHHRAGVPPRPTPFESDSWRDPE